MHETQVNGTQADEKRVEETLDDEAMGDEAMGDETMGDETPSDGGGGDGWGVEKARRLRLGEFLRDLIRQEGKMEAAELLGVNNKTLTRAEESGEITGRMADALELLLRRADDAEVARLRETVGALEERLAAVEGRAEMPEGGVETPGAETEGRGGSGREGNGDKDETDSQGKREKEDDTESRAQDGKDDAGAGRSETGAAPQAVRLRPVNPDTLRPFDPEIVTVEPADDDVDIYGAAWPLVEEWRSLRADHPNQGKGLSWLRTRERLLALELAMLEEHGLTLPPEKQPLRGFGRSGQTTWRRTALANTRRSLARRELLRWVAPWLWRK